MTRSFRMPAAALLCMAFAGTAGAVTTGHYGLHWQAFSPASDSSACNYVYSNFLGGIASGVTGACFSAGVNLPDGATITAVSFWHTSSSGTESFDFFRTAVSDGTSVKLISKQDTNSTGQRKTVNVAVHHLNVVDNTRYLYGVLVCLGNANNDTFQGARITYTTP